MRVCQYSYQDLTTLTTKSSPLTRTLVRSHMESPANSKVTHAGLSEIVGLYELAAVQCESTTEAGCFWC